MSEALKRHDWHHEAPRTDWTYWEPAQARIDALNAKIAALEADAARYRFLREKTWNIENVSGPDRPDVQWSVSFYSKYGTTTNENDPDRAIDAAMQAKP